MRRATGPRVIQSGKKVINEADCGVSIITILTSVENPFPQIVTTQTPQGYRDSLM